MTFRISDTDKDFKSGYLFVDDLVGVGEPVPEELLKSMPPIKGKAISGTLGIFNIKDFERIVGKLERCANTAKMKRTLN